MTLRPFMITCEKRTCCRRRRAGRCCLREPRLTRVRASGCRRRQGPHEKCRTSLPIVCHGLREVWNDAYPPPRQVWLSAKRWVGEAEVSSSLMPSGLSDYLERQPGDLTAFLDVGEPRASSLRSERASVNEKND